MKIILLSLSVVFFVIGVHQSFYYGIQASYWSFMLCGFSYLAFEYLKRQSGVQEEGNPAPKGTKGKKDRNRGKG